MTPDKLAALKALGLSDAIIEQLLDDVATTEKEADAEQVRYKGATMTKNPDYDVMDVTYDVLDRINDRHGMPAAIAVAEAMARTGADLESGRAVLKEGRAVYKELSTGPGMELYKRALKEVGEDAVHAALKAMVDQAVATRSTRSDPTDAFARIVQGGLNSDMTPR